MINIFQIIFFFVKKFINDYHYIIDLTVVINPNLMRKVLLTFNDTFFPIPNLFAKNVFNIIEFAFSLHRMN